MRKKILSALAIFYLITIAYAFLLAQPITPVNQDETDEKIEQDVLENIEVPSEPEVIDRTPASETSSSEGNKVVLEPPPTTETKQHWGLTFSGGTFKPDDFKGKGTTYSDIYGSNPGAWADLAFEWQFLKKFGRLGAKVTTGSWVIMKEFDSPTDSDTIKDNYTLWVFPAVGGGIYRFHYWKNQPLIPFIEGGVGFLRFEQFTTDKNDQYKDVYRYVRMGGIGLQLNLDLLDGKSARDFDFNWGVNTTYLVAELRTLNTSQFRVDSKSRKRNFDFSGNRLLTAGLLFEF